MAKLLLHLYQGNGCDYTISCGETIVEFEAYSSEEIGNKVREKIEYFGRENVQIATLYEVNENKGELDIDGLFAADDVAATQEAKDIKELEERRVLAELKIKYTNS